MKTTTHNQKNNLKNVSKMSYKNIVITILTLITIYSCSPNEEVNLSVAPRNATPENGKSFSSDEVLSPVIFRWTPVSPKPQQPVTYKLRVWQLMQGQNGTQAMRVNQPIIIRNVVGLEEVSVSGMYTGPCKPPYLCDFIWTVEAVDIYGNPIGTSNPTVFNF